MVCVVRDAESARQRTAEWMRASAEALQPGLEYLTAGQLLAALAKDPVLTIASAVVVDDADRLDALLDALLPLLRQTLRLRTQQPAGGPFRLVLAMAPGAACGIVRRCFTPPGPEYPALVRVPAATFPVHVCYEQGVLGPRAPADIQVLLVAKVIALCSRGASGDMLVFVPDADMCDRVVSRLSAELKDAAVCLPLHDGLSAGAQQRAFAACPGRKIVVAARLAFIPSVSIVVDTGLAAATSDSRPRMVTQEVAQQRAACAGAAGPDGVCHRLYSPQAWDYLPAEGHDLSLTERCSAVLAVLRQFDAQPMAVPTADVAKFPFPLAFDLPPVLQRLQMLGACDAHCRLTAQGAAMASALVLGDAFTAAACLQAAQLSTSHATAMVALLVMNDRPAEPRLFVDGAPPSNSYYGDLGPALAIWLRASQHPENVDDDWCKAQGVRPDVLRRRLARVSAWLEHLMVSPPPALDHEAVEQLAPAVVGLLASTWRHEQFRSLGDGRLFATLEQPVQLTLLSATALEAPTCLLLADFVGPRGERAMVSTPASPAPAGLAPVSVRSIPVASPALVFRFSGPGLKALIALSFI